MGGEGKSMTGEMSSALVLNVISGWSLPRLLEILEASDQKTWKVFSCHHD